MCAGEGESDWHVLTVTTGGDADFRQVRAASQIGGGVWVAAVALVGAVLGVMADAGDTSHGRVDESIDAVLDHGLFDSVGECRHLLVDNRLDFVALKLAGALHVRLVAFDSSRIDRSIRVSQVLEAVALPDGGLTDAPDTGVGHEVHRPAFFYMHVQFADASLSPRNQHRVRWFVAWTDTCPSALPNASGVSVTLLAS